MKKKRYISNAETKLQKYNRIVVKFIVLKTIPTSLCLYS